MISEPIVVKALENFRLFVKFADGTEGVVDLSELRSKGVFKAWDRNEVFGNVYIDKETKAIAWDENLEIDVNNLYLKIIGKSFEEWKKENVEHAAN